jgi:ketosteroid isomerase-like protein
MNALPKPLKSWLRNFSKAVRDRDFVSGRRLYDVCVVSFGTVRFRAEGLDELFSRQWQAAWPKTRNFDFEYDSAAALVEKSRAVIIVSWTSTVCIRVKKFVKRRGRATIVLQKYASGWKAIHTHFSISPASNHDPLLRHTKSSLHDS